MSLKIFDGDSDAGDDIKYDQKYHQIIGYTWPNNSSQIVTFLARYDNVYEQLVCCTGQYLTDSDTTAVKLGIGISTTGGVKCSQAADTELDSHSSQGTKDKCFSVYLFHFGTTMLW